MQRYFRVLGAILLTTATATALQQPQEPQVLFTDGFESGLARWSVLGAPYVKAVTIPDTTHGRVLMLESGGDVLALIKDSETWGAVRFEADVLFPTDEDNYLGIVYNHRQRGERRDFGLVYIKGNDNYLQVNPHRDFNVSRTLYPEGRAALTGDAAFKAGDWKRIAVEISGATCHFYVGDLRTPQLTFSLFEHSAGAIGVQPRSVGGPVWIDNVRVIKIDALSYRGAPRPAVSYSPESMLTDWQVIGPLPSTEDDVARHPTDASHQWRAFATDARGAVVTGSVTDYHGPNTVAYFRHNRTVAIGEPAVLHLSTVDDLAVWVNGRFHWFVPRAGFAWYDFLTNTAHAGQRIPIQLESGSNDIVVRVRGGVYASGGFFAAIE